MVQTLRGGQAHADLVLANLGGLEAYLGAKRSAGASFEQIARDMFSDSGGAVSVSYTTIKRWLIDFGLLEVVAS